MVLPACKTNLPFFAPKTNLTLSTNRPKKESPAHIATKLSTANKNNNNKATKKQSSMGSDKGQLQCGVSIDLNKSQYDLSTYLGRAKHFFSVTDPRLAFVSSTKLDEAKQLVTDYEAGKCAPVTTEADLREAKRLFDSAYHPQTVREREGSMCYLFSSFVLLSLCLKLTLAHLWLDFNFRFNCPERTAVSAWPNVLPSLGKHVHHRCHAHLLQVSKGGGVSLVKCFDLRFFFLFVFVFCCCCFASAD